MTTREKIDNLLNESSNSYLVSIWKYILNYYDYHRLETYGYTIGQTRYDLYQGGEIIAEIQEILKNGNHIMYYNTYWKKFELDVNWNDLFLTYNEAKDVQIKIATDYLEKLKTNL